MKALVFLSATLDHVLIGKAGPEICSGLMQDNAGRSCAPEGFPSRLRGLDHAPVACRARLGYDGMICNAAIPACEAR
jgi:hypothetical protein